MCGITGYIHLNGEPVSDSGTILNMLKIQKHRGPDDSGIRAFSLANKESIEISINAVTDIEGKYNGILGFNRLSILDLSANGHQPMESPDHQVVLTLNGEIYNAFDFKKELTDWGYHFKSTSDTEVVLALYLRYGIEGMLSRLNGMFAIVIIDLRSDTLYVMRDRFGIKPMYYILNNDLFAFSSELKCFGYLRNFRFRLLEKQLDEFLLFRANLKGTLLEGTESLQPGHYLACKAGKVSMHRYFDVNNYKRSDTNNESLNSYAVKLEKWLEKSVHRQLMSDVKLGCQLSGGIDSSLVTWLANNNSEKGNFEAVSIVFDNASFSEEKFINKVTEKLGIPSHKFLLDSSYYLDSIEKATWHLETPLNHPNTVAIYKLSQRAKEYVTVLLSGEGADEVFGGYERFYEVSFPYKIRRLLHEIKKNRSDPASMIEYLSEQRRAVMATAFMLPAFARKIKKDFQKVRAVSDRIALYESLTGSLFDRQVKYEMNAYLPDLLIRQDKMSMAHSIENRVPFLDNEVVENAFTIPEKYLLLRKSPEGTNTEKYLLKKITALQFGNEFAFRQKMGFGIPVREFFTTPGFSEYLRDKVLPGVKNRGLFDHQIASDWFSKITTLTSYEMEALWVIVSFEIWASIYLDNTYENWHTRN